MGWFGDPSVLQGFCFIGNNMKKHPTVERLKELLAYDEASGQLVWKYSRGNQVYAGRVAGSLFSARGKMYYIVRVDGCSILAHRVVWAMWYGVWPNKHIDHIDGDGLNNRVCNIREVYQGENNRNAAVRKDSKTGVTGVRMRGGKFISTIRVNGEDIWLGVYATIDEASKARADASIKYGFHPNHGRKAVNNEREAA